MRQCAYSLHKNINTSFPVVRVNCSRDNTVWILISLPVFLLLSKFSVTSLNTSRTCETINDGSPGLGSEPGGSVDVFSTCVKIAFVKARLQSLDFYVESCSRNRKTETR